jgi:hypothetical protein
MDAEGGDPGTDCRSPDGAKRNPRTAKPELAADPWILLCFTQTTDATPGREDVATIMSQKQLRPFMIEFTISRNLAREHLERQWANR